MLPSSIVLVPLASALSLAALYSLVRVLTQGFWAARIENLLTATMCMALVAAALGWDPVPAMPLVWIFAAAALWFVLQAILHRQHWLRSTELGSGGCLYRGAMMGLTLWIIASSPGGGDGTSAHGLGYILTHLIGAIVLAFTAAGWLLATFAVPRQDTTTVPVRRVRGIHESLMAAGIAMTLFAMI